MFVTERCETGQLLQLVVVGESKRGFFSLLASDRTVWEDSGMRYELHLSVSTMSLEDSCVVSGMIELSR